MGIVDGVEKQLFGWDTDAGGQEYGDFLRQFLRALKEELGGLGIEERTYFHISDEPNLESMETYKIASDIMRPLIGDSKTFDALSNYDFYEKGLIACPVTSVEHIHEFLEHEV